jgi:hypothetical protein
MKLSTALGFLLLIFLACPQLLLADDNGLPRLLLQFSAAKLAAEAEETAIYIDQLDALRLNLVAKENAAAVDRVAAEMKVAQVRLAALKAKLQQAAPAADPVDKELRALFSGEDGGMLLVRDAKRTPASLARNTFWAFPQAACQWTIRDLTAGKYKVRVMFLCPKGDGGGTGQLELSGNAAPIPFRIQPDDSVGAKIQSIEVATLDFEKLPLELIIRSSSLTKAGTPLFELIAVRLVRDAAPSNGAELKKVDF